MAERRLSPRVGFRQLLAIVLAGGRGQRLYALTKTRCKPALPIGKHRIVDFALANVLNSRIIDRTMLLTQYQQQGLIDHLNDLGLNSKIWGKAVNIFPAQQQLGESWYEGTANAVYQNHKHIRDDPADTVAVLAADHIYKLDLRQMLDFHRERRSCFTVCGMVMPIAEAAGNFGVMELDTSSRIIGFEEKPKSPKSLPGSPGECFSSMGIYIFDKEYLLYVLEADHANPGSKHDFGGDIIPQTIAEGAAIFGYDYGKNVIPGESKVYWRDVGRIGPFHETVMDLVAVNPRLSIYNNEWPIPTAWDMLPPAKFVTPDLSRLEREHNGVLLSERIVNTIVSGGCIFDSHLRFVDSVFGRSVRTEFGADIEKSIIFDGAKIGAYTKLRFAIVEEGVAIPNGVRIGFDIEEDARNGVYIDEGHNPAAWYPPIRVVTKDAHFAR